MTLTTSAPILTKRCTNCGKEKPVAEFFKRSPGPGWRHRCKHCYQLLALPYNRDWQRQHRRPKPNKQSDASRRSVRRWMAKNRDRMRIAKAVGLQVKRAIERGLLQRPTVCEECGQESTRIQAAHADYSKPLDVRWLCSRCHQRWDHATPKTKAVA